MELNGLQINVPAVILAAMAGLALGMLGYGLIFAKPWARLMGYDPKRRPSPKMMAKGVGLLAIANILFAWVLAFYLAGWRRLPGAPSEIGDGRVRI